MQLFFLICLAAIFPAFTVTASLAEFNTTTIANVTNELRPNEQEAGAVENTVLTISCPAEYYMEISGAEYRSRQPNECDFSTNMLLLIRSRCDGLERCQIQVNDESLEVDSCYDMRDYLSVRYFCYPEFVLDKEFICEGNQGTISCSQHDDFPLLGITWATYGRRKCSTCRRGIILTCNCGWDVTKEMQRGCNGLDSCTLFVENSRFGGDPCLGTAKYLTVEYKCYRNTTVNYERLIVSQEINQIEEEDPA